VEKMRAADALDLRTRADGMLDTTWAAAWAVDLLGKLERDGAARCPTRIARRKGSVRKGRPLPPPPRRE
jgi:hypothetical protein